MKKDLNSFLRQAEGEALQAEKKVQVRALKNVPADTAAKEAAAGVEEYVAAQEWTAIEGGEAALDLQGLSQLAATDGFVMDFDAASYSAAESAAETPPVKLSTAFAPWAEDYVPAVAEEAWLDAPVEAQLVEAAEAGAAASGGIGAAGVVGLTAAALAGIAAASSGSSRSVAQSEMEKEENKQAGYIGNDAVIQTDAASADAAAQTGSAVQPHAAMPSETEPAGNTVSDTGAQNTAAQPQTDAAADTAPAGDTAVPTHTDNATDPAQNNANASDGTVVVQPDAADTSASEIPVVDGGTAPTPVTDNSAAANNTGTSGTAAPTDGGAAGGQAAAGTPGHFGNYLIYSSSEYGNYIRVNDFGADPTGKQDSLAAIKAALAVAGQEQVMLYMDGTYYVSDQIVMNADNAGAKGIFGSGMGQTVIQFNKAQEGIFNSNTNHDDIRAYAGILIDGQNGKTISGLSVQYTHPDFYRAGQTYFGKVCGILVNDADNTLISKVEASGANRAGVLFTSTAALSKEEGNAATYKARIQSGEIDEHYANLPLGSNNRVIDSNLHNNRVAGLMVSYQEDFVAEGNTLSRNGHEADGGTGYGATVMAGSYNYGVTFRGNTTDHNYRKGLDVHDGNGFVIENNTLNGDRLYGIAVYNRQFSMDNVVIKGNTVTQDPGFRLETDDDLGAYYQLYSAIQLQTNTQFRDLHSASTGYFEISNNTINNLTVYGNSVQQYGIEFRNHETDMNYTLNITGNNISGESTKYLIAVINDTKDQVTGQSGIGSGTINISNNTADIGTIVNGAVPVYIEEKNSSNIALHGSVTVDGNQVTVRDNSNGYSEFAYMRGNAAEYNVTNNALNLGGKLNDGIIEVHGTGNGAADVDLNVANNTLLTDIVGKIYQSWLRYTDAEVFSDGNTHNGTALDAVNTTGTALTLNDVLSSVSKTVAAANEMAYTIADGSATVVENNTVNGNIVV